MAEFSAQIIADMLASNANVFAALATRLGVDLSGKDQREQIDAVYNAALYLVSTGRADDVFGNPPVQDVLIEDALDDLEYVDDDVDSEEATPDFDSMTKAELIEYAAEHEIDIDARATKADIIAAIRESEGS